MPMMTALHVRVDAIILLRSQEDIVDAENDNNLGEINRVFFFFLRK